MTMWLLYTMEPPWLYRHLRRSYSQSLSTSKSSKAKSNKFYAVRVGREGPQIHRTWNEAKKDVVKFSGAIHKSFDPLADAERWLETPPATLTQIPVSKSPKKKQTHANQSAVSNCTVPRSTRKLSFEPRLDDSLAPNLSPVVLSPDQQAVLDRVRRGENVFFTGPAGKYWQISFAAGDHQDTRCDCFTGIAAINIGGTTLNSWAGIGLGKGSKERLLKKIRGIGRQRTRHWSLYNWRTVETLIIDEVSMIDGMLFHRLESIARTLRNNDAPFGGIQLVLSGDFLQLPPVPDQIKDKKIPMSFAFEAASWSRCIDRPMPLTQIFRQSDHRFIEILNSMRLGIVEPEATLAIENLSRTVKYPDNIEPTDLCPTRREVDIVNAARMKMLNSKEYTYISADFPGLDEENKPVPIALMEKLLERLVAPKRVTLKVGAQVMLIKNLPPGLLVNGSVGRVIDFSTREAAAMAGIQAASMGEVRKGAEVENHIGVWPVVEFSNEVKMLCTSACFEVCNAQGDIEAIREQVPLILAWSVTIHKSQGQTLQRVRVDLDRTFEKGQVYVALSRATSMETLQVLNFHPEKVRAHPRALAWIKRQTG